MKIKPLLLGTAAGLMIGLLMCTALMIFGTCPALSVLNLPAFYVLARLTNVSVHYSLLGCAVIFQWMCLGAAGSSMILGWWRKGTRRWMVLGMTAILVSGLALVRWQVKSDAKGNLTAPTYQDEKVYQGMLPGYGQIIFNLDWHSSLAHNLLCQQTGEYWHLQKNYKNGKLASASVEDESQANLGQLIFQGEPAVGDWLQGTWQPANRKTVEPVKFQCVSALWQREHDYVYYEQIVTVQVLRGV